MGTSVVRNLGINTNCVQVVFEPVYRQRRLVSRGTSRNNRPVRFDRYASIVPHAGSFAIDGEPFQTEGVIFHCSTKHQNRLRIESLNFGNRNLGAFTEYLRQNYGMNVNSWDHKVATSPKFSQVSAGRLFDTPGWFESGYQNAHFNTYTE